VSNLEKLNEIISWLETNPTHYMQLGPLNNKIIEFAVDGRKALSENGDGGLDKHILLDALLQAARAQEFDPEYIDILKLIAVKCGRPLDNDEILSLHDLKESFRLAEGNF